MEKKLINYLNRFVSRIVNLITTNPGDKEPQFYAKDIFKGYKYVFGDYTYGKPKILFDNGSENLIVGNYCSIAENVTIFLGGNHSTIWLTTYPFNKLFESEYEDTNNIQKFSSSKGTVQIGNDVWIGYGSIILSGVKIGNGSIIAAGSVITKDIGSYEIWGGNPARLIRKRFTELQIKEIEKIAWWFWDHNKVKANIKILCSENADEFIEIHREVK